MHTVEHVGLGRYGEPMDPDGDLKAMVELKRVLAVGGSLLFVVPMGRNARIRFNANRTYTYEQIMEYFAELELKQFAYIRQTYIGIGTLVIDAPPKLTKEDEEGCGCFLFRK